MIKISLDIARGLEYMHRLGIIHCDIAPRNILLNENNQAWFVIYLQYVFQFII